MTITSLSSLSCFGTITTTPVVMASSFLGMGILVGAASQWLLVAAAAMLWGYHHCQFVAALSSSSSIGLLLSLAWSVAAAALGCSLLSSRLSNYILRHEKDVDEFLFSGRRDDRLIRTLLLRAEASYIVGCLVGICGAWIVLDVAVYDLPHQILPSLVLLLVSLVAFVAILQCYPETDLRSNRTTTTTQATIPSAFFVKNINLVAGSICMGILVGAASQWLLAALFWHRQYLFATTLLSSSSVSIWIFSLVWSALTVAGTALGCSLLSCALSNYILRHEKNDDESLFSDRRDECLIRTLLRAEASYIVGCLVGICGAWIVLDVAVYDLPHQILPSLVLLLVSLVAFVAILQCFPETKCFNGCVDGKKSGENGLSEPLLTRPVTGTWDGSLQTV